jgi:hypothetical protein
MKNKHSNTIGIFFYINKEANNALAVLIISLCIFTFILLSSENVLSLVALAAGLTNKFFNNTKTSVIAPIVLTQILKRQVE